MIPSSRRSFMQLLGFTPMASLGSSRQMQALLDDPLFGAAAKIAAPSGKEQDMSNIERTFGKAVARQFDKARDDFNNEADQRSRLRLEGLDHDLHCLRSVSRAYKVQKQLQRNLETCSLFDRWHFMMWGR